MLPFLLDDIARLKHDDLQREALELQRMAEVSRGMHGGPRPQALRRRAGSFLLSFGSWLAEPGEGAARRAGSTS